MGLVVAALQLSCCEGSTGLYPGWQPGFAPTLISRLHSAVGVPKVNTVPNGVGLKTQAGSNTRQRNK